MTLRNTKYKQIYRFQLFGDDDILRTSADSVYATGLYTNVKLMRFDLKTIFNNYVLSNNARLVLESCNLPNITGATNYVILRMRNSSDDVNFDSKKLSTGNPAVCSFKSSNQTIINSCDTLYNMSITSNFFNKNSIDFEIEVKATANIDFLTSNPLDNFYISFVLLDVDDELTFDNDLAPPVSKNQILNNLYKKHIT